MAFFPLFRLFALRFFIMSSFCVALFRNKKTKKRKWHKPVIILKECKKKIDCTIYVRDEAKIKALVCASVSAYRLV